MHRSDVPIRRASEALVPKESKPMKKLVYSVAMSLDGYIAGPNDEFDWIPMDPAIDFAAIFSQFDVFVMGRRTFEVTRGQGGDEMAGAAVYVFSTTLQQEDYPEVIVSTDPVGTVAELRQGEGRSRRFLFSIQR